MSWFEEHVEPSESTLITPGTGVGPSMPTVTWLPPVTIREVQPVGSSSHIAGTIFVVPTWPRTVADRVTVRPRLPRIPLKNTGSVFFTMIRIRWHGVPSFRPAPKCESTISASGTGKWRVTVYWPEVTVGDAWTSVPPGEQTVWDTSLPACEQNELAEMAVDPAAFRFRLLMASVQAPTKLPLARFLPPASAARSATL